MNSISFERQQNLDGTSLTRISGTLQAGSHTTIQMAMNVAMVNGERSLMTLQCELLEAAISELQADLRRIRSQQPATPEAPN